MKKHLFATWNVPQFTNVIPLARRLDFPVSQPLMKRSRAVLIAVALAFAGWSPLPARAADLTILNPTPEAGDNFGETVARVGNNVLVFASSDNTSAPDVGAVYLMDGTTGALLQTFLSPEVNPTFFGLYLGGFSEGPFSNNVLVRGRYSDSRNISAV